jgi:hypothetical protein
VAGSNGIPRALTEPLPPSYILILKSMGLLIRKKGAEEEDD